MVKFGYEIGGLLTNLVFKLPNEPGLCIGEGTQVLPVVTWIFYLLLTQDINFVDLFTASKDKSLQAVDMNTGGIAHSVKKAHKYVKLMFSVKEHLCLND